MTQQRAAAERAPGLNEDAVIHAEAERGALRVAGMNLKLIHHGLHLRAGEERHEVVREEVGNADEGIDEAVGRAPWAAGQ